MTEAEVWSEAVEKLTKTVESLQAYADRECQNHRESVVVLQCVGMVQTLVTYFEFRSKEAKKKGRA